MRVRGAYGDRGGVVADGCAAPLQRVPAAYRRAVWRRWLLARGGGTLTNSFCPDCGSTAFWTVTKHPGLLGIAAGAFAGPGFPPPLRSVWEVDRLAWIDIAAPQHFDRGAS